MLNSEYRWYYFKRKNRIGVGDLVQLSSYRLYLSRKPNLTIFLGEMGVVVEGNISHRSGFLEKIEVQWILPETKTEMLSFRELKLIRTAAPPRLYREQHRRKKESAMARQRKHEERKAQWRGEYLARRKRISRRWVGGTLFILLSLFILSSL